MRFSLAALAAAVSAYAQLTVIEPSADHWWVAESINTVRWTGTQPTTFNIFLVNSDQTVLNDKLALVSVQPVYEYSKSFTPGSNVKAAQGYTIQFTDTLNSSNVYASSQTFEIKAKGAAYPSQNTASAGAGGSGTVSGSGSPTSSNPAASATSTGAAVLGAQAGLLPALFGGALAALALV